MPPAENIHASCIVLGDRGVLITGRSGSGKTALALGLIVHFGATGLLARLVADDRTILRRRSERVIGCAPPSISGLVEAHGVGPRPIRIASEAVLDLVVDLVPQEAALRFNDDETRAVAGCPLPLLVLPERNVDGAILAVAAKLRLPPFG